MSKETFVSKFEEATADVLWALGEEQEWWGKYSGSWRDFDEEGKKIYLSWVKRLVRPNDHINQTLHGAFLLDKAIELGWKKEDGEGIYEFICRRHYEQGVEDERNRTNHEDC